MLNRSCTVFGEMKYTVMILSPKVRANSVHVDPNHTAPKEQSDQGLHM